MLGTKLNRLRLLRMRMRWINRVSGKLTSIWNHFRLMFKSKAIQISLVASLKKKTKQNKNQKKSYMQSKRWKVKVPGLQLLREVASLLWQSTESFNNRQRAHDGSGPMGFKRINIQVNSKQRCIMGTALHLWIGEKEKNILNAIYNIQNTRHAQQQKCLLKKWILHFELVPKQKCIYYTLVKSI